MQTSEVSHVFGQKGSWIPKTEHVWKPNNPKEKMNAFPTNTHTHTYTHLLRNVLSNCWCGMHRTCKDNPVKPNRRNEKNIYIYKYMGLRWPPAATYNCAQVHHQSPAGTFTRVPGRCLRWSPTPPGTPVTPCKIRSFTSIQMVHTHTHTRPTAAGQMKWKWKWDDNENEMSNT